jgi:hypothetical protein
MPSNYYLLRRRVRITAFFAVAFGITYFDIGVVAFIVSSFLAYVAFFVAAAFRTAVRAPFIILVV